MHTNSCGEDMNISFLLIVVVILRTCHSANSTITPATPIADGETLVSPNGEFEVGFFSPSNSSFRYLAIWYKNIPVEPVVWVANRAQPLTDKSGVLLLDDNGALILRDQFSKLYWASNSSGVPNISQPVAQLLDSGNFVVTDQSTNLSGDESYIWQSFDYPTDTMLAGMKLGWTTKPRTIDRYLTTWQSSYDPSPGFYTYSIDQHWPPQLLLLHGDNITSRNGPYNGIQFSGLRYQPLDGVIQLEFSIVREQSGYYMFNVTNSSVVTRVVLNQSQIQMQVWFSETNEWRFYWTLPNDQCQNYALCGPYSICNSSIAPSCQCLKWFHPKSAKDWSSGNTSGGCIRNTQLNCSSSTENNLLLKLNGSNSEFNSNRWTTDGFLLMPGMKLPDARNTYVNESMNLDQCGQWCLDECNCTAFSSYNVRTESGCIAWYGDLVDLRQMAIQGQDLYIRLAASELDANVTDTKQKKKHTPVIVATVTCGLLLLALVFYCIHKKAKRGYKQGIQAPSCERTSSALCLDISKSEELELPLYDLVTIHTATNGFSPDNKLGEGGFGPVFKGKLRDGQEVAVKRLSAHSSQGIDELRNEVMLIAKLQHRNLVRLLGFCIQGEERMLMYEYLHNRSLDVYIFDKSSGKNLDWQKRYEIIIGIARGLVYLHQDSIFRIVHRDLKASNILLDKFMNPKISDFGTARLFGGDDLTDKTKRVVGTYGYMSPEYAMDGIFSVKSDVFSFGVLVLEIISGKRNKGIYYFESETNLLGHAWRLQQEGKGLELLDDSISDPFHASEVLRCIHVSLLCVQERARDRPLMPTVLMMLLSESSVFLPQPKEPGFFVARTTSPECTVNGLTITALEGR